MLADPRDFGYEGVMATRGESLFCLRKDIDHVVIRVEDNIWFGGEVRRRGWAGRARRR